MVWEDPYSIQSIPFKTSIDTKDPYNGAQCLVVKGTDIFGQNDDLGGFVEINGVKLYYEIYGDGSPLLLLHGAGQSIIAFKKQID